MSENRNVDDEERNDLSKICTKCSLACLLQPDCTNLANLANLSGFITHLQKVGWIWLRVSTVMYNSFE